jgi:quinol monooxygenase YgiN
MSVYVMLQFKADPKRLQEVMASDPERLQAINSRAKGLGAIHHQFVTGDDGTVAVFDEWESAEGFQKFFDSSPEIPKLMAEAGVTSQPEITFWHRLDTPDAF